MLIYKDLRINQNIRSTNIRLVDDKGEQVGIVSLELALQSAQEKNLDLVEVAPDSDPPVCKILNYSRYRFASHKQAQQAHKKQKKSQLKEVKFRSKIDRHDYQFKVKHIETFLSKGDKVKVTLRFRGREMAHVDLGEALFARIQEDLKDQMTLEKEPKLEGRQLLMILLPNIS